MTWGRSTGSDFCSAHLSFDGVQYFLFAVFILYLVPPFCQAAQHCPRTAIIRLPVTDLLPTQTSDIQFISARVLQAIVETLSLSHILLQTRQLLHITTIMLASQLRGKELQERHPHLPISHMGHGGSQLTPDNAMS